MHLVNDEDALIADCRHVSDLIDDFANVFDRVVGGSIELMDIEAAAFVEGHAALAGIASFAVFWRIHAIDGLGQNAGAGGLAHAAWPGKQKCMRQLPHFDGILERIGHMRLAYYRIKGSGPILSS